MSISHGWIGGVTSTSAVIKARSDQSAVSATTDPSTSTFNGTEGNDDVFTVALTGLTPNTAYEVTVDDGDGTWVATFTTFPTGAASFKFAAGGDSGQGGGTFSVDGVSPDATTWDSIAEDDPLFFLHCGDLHYKNINSASESSYYPAYQELLDGKFQTLMQSVPIAYVWDDHDFCGNDSHGGATGKEAANDAYRTWVPSYTLDESDSIHQSFTVGRVRFILTDSRSSRDSKATADSSSKTMLGAAQKEWLHDELAAATEELIVLVLPNPWIQSKGSHDAWGGFTFERAEIAGWISQYGLTNRTLIVSADMHNLAWDDGSNSQYNPHSQAPGPRVVQCGKIDASGINIGGPYSGGIFGSSNQMYVTVEVDDDGTDLDVTVRGWAVSGTSETEVFTQQFTAGDPLPDDWFILAEVEEDTTQYDDTDLEPNTEYFYKVVAFNEAWTSGDSAVVSATTDGEEAEGSGTVEAVGSLSASGSHDAEGSGVVEGVGSLSAESEGEKSGSGEVVGFGSLSAAGATDAEGSGVVEGEASLVAAGAAAAEGSGEVSGVASLSATGQEGVPTEPPAPTAPARTGLRFEAWTMPTAAVFEKKFDIPYALAGATGVRELSYWADGSLPIPAQHSEGLEGSWIKVFLGSTLIDEFAAVRLNSPSGRPSVRTASGPQRNGVVEGIGIAPKGYPNHQDGDLDWQWGAKNLLPDFSLASLGNIREVWEVWHDHTSGQWNVEVDEDDVDIDHDATPTEIEGSNIGGGSGIQGLSTVQDVTVSGEGSEDDPWIITFYDPADPTGVAFTAGTLSGGTTFSATRTTAGALDPYPITIARPVDAQGGDTRQHGRYQNPPLTVDVDPSEQDGDSEWVLEVDVASGFGGSQYFPIDVIPGKTYSNITARVKPTEAGRYGLIIRDEFSGDIYRQFQDMVADTWQDLTPATITIPEGVHRVLMRISVDDDDTPTSFRVNWQSATFLEGEPEATFTQIVRELLEAAQARGTGTFLELDATDEADTNGTSLTPMSFTQYVGDKYNLSHTLQEGARLKYQWRVVPADEAEVITPAGTTTHVLQIFYVSANEIEDLTATPGGPSVTVGSHVRSADVVSRQPEFTVAIGLGVGALSVEVDRSSSFNNVRIERIFDVEHLASTASITEYLEARFDEQDRNLKAASATVLATAPHVPGVHFAEGSKIWWQFPGTLPKEARPVKRFTWTHGQTAEFTLQGSRVLTGEAALVAAVDMFLREPGRRRGERPPVFPEAGGEGGMAHVLVVSTSEPTSVRLKADYVVPSEDSASALQDVFDALGTQDGSGSWSIWLAGEFDLDADVATPSGAWIRGLGYTVSGVEV